MVQVSAQFYISGKLDNSGLDCSTNDTLCQKSELKLKVISILPWNQLFVVHFVSFIPFYDAKSNPDSSYETIKETKKILPSVPDPRSCIGSPSAHGPVYNDIEAQSISGSAAESKKWPTTYRNSNVDNA